MTRPTSSITLAGPVLAVTGEVDAATVIDLRAQGEGFIRRATGPLTVDLSDLVTAHSVVLSMLLCWQRLAQEVQCPLTFRGANKKLISLAALSNLDNQIPGFAPHG